MPRGYGRVSARGGCRVAVAGWTASRRSSKASVVLVHGAPPCSPSDEPSPALVPASSAYAARAPPLSMGALDSDGWSVLGESDAEADGDMSGPEPEGDLAGSVASLSLSDAEGGVGLDRTPLVDRRRQGPDVLRSRLLERQRRSASSPSRSPARRAPQRARQRAEHVVRPQPAGRRSFYEYLFA